MQIDTVSDKTRNSCIPLKGISISYRIAQNSGGVKLWQIDHFRVLERKTLVNLRVYYLATYT